VAIAKGFNRVATATGDHTEAFVNGDNSGAAATGARAVGTRTDTDQVSRIRGATTRPTAVGLRHLAPGRWAAKAAAFTVPVRPRNCGHVPRNGADSAAHRKRVDQRVPLHLGDPCPSRRLGGAW